MSSINNITTSADTHQTHPHNDPASKMGVFFSPPEATKADTFSFSQSPLRSVRTAIEQPTAFSRPMTTPYVLPPMSPPVSPATRIEQKLGQQDEPHVDVIDGVSDPELFPARKTSDQAAITSPLFKPADGQADPDPVDLHVQAREASGHKGPKPSRQDYDLAVSFRSKVWENYNRDPAAYLAKELEYLEAYPARWAPKQKSAVKSTKRKMNEGAPPTKRQRQSTKTTMEKLPAPKRVPRPSPRDKPLDDFSAEPIVIKHRRKVSRATPTPREDMDYRNVPDFSPPVSTIAPGKNLKIDWKGHPLDLADDSDKSMLDESEVALASILRLTAAQYLFAKRKIFERFVELARIGKDFNKTSAQAVCKIDVNKASKLWTAFEKVGWFDKKLFTRYL